MPGIRTNEDHRLSKKERERSRPGRMLTPEELQSLKEHMEKASEELDRLLDEESDLPKGPDPSE